MGVGPVVKEEQKEVMKRLVGEMRESFDQRDWDKTLSTYEQVAELKADRALRLEATCLAVRALSAAKQRPAARSLLRRLGDSTYKKPVHYEFLARAYLDLKQYKKAAEACERAEELREAEEKPA